MIFPKSFKIKSRVKKIKSMQQYRQHNQPSDEVLAKEVALYRSLADIYKSLRKSKKYPFADQMVNECLRAAAEINSAESQYELGKNLLEEAKFRANLETEGVFANPINERYARQMFEESHAWLENAEKLGHILSRRLRGLCYVNGWGVSPDMDKGFELIVASIDQEGSWDRVPQIFESMGLNKPEFFSALGKHRQKV